jgi:hypothetical protein
MRSTELDALDHVLDVFGKLLTSRGAWVSQDSMMFGLVVQKFLNIE